jgi:4-hydroxy-tetrahydrodipicolinate reductase
VTFRVIQWATGHVGIHALRAIVNHPELELVGLCTSSAAKRGRDAGELVGLPRTGVVATDDVEAVLAADADCVSYMGATDFRLQAALDDMCRILASGKDLVTTSFVPLIYPPALPESIGLRLADACRAGGATLFCSGIDPGFSPDALPIVLSSLSERIDSIRAQEIFDYATYDQPETLFEVMGFGKPPGAKVPMLLPGALAFAWGGSVRMIARALAVELDEVRQRHEVALAEQPIELSCGRIEPGTQAGLRFEVMGIVRGEPRIVVEHVTRLHPAVAPEWPVGNGPGTYRILVEGMPSMKLDLDIGFRSLDHNVDGCVASAMRVVNAIPHVCRAEPGLKSWLDLPGVAGAHAMRF